MIGCGNSRCRPARTVPDGSRVAEMPSRTSSGSRGSAASSGLSARYSDGGTSRRCLPGGGEAAVQPQAGDLLDRVPAHRHALGVGGDRLQVAGGSGHHRGVGPAAVIVDVQAHRIDVGAGQPGLLAGFPDRRAERVLVAVPGAAGHPPAVALMGPRRAVLQDHPAGVAQQQAGRAVATPVPVAGGALHPAVTGTHRWVPIVSRRPAGIPARGGCPKCGGADPPGRLSASGRSWRRMWDRGPWIEPTPRSSLPGGTPSPGFLERLPPRIGSARLPWIGGTDRPSAPADPAG